MENAVKNLQIFVRDTFFDDVGGFDRHVVDDAAETHTGWGDLHLGTPAASGNIFLVNGVAALDKIFNGARGCRFILAAKIGELGDGQSGRMVSEEKEHHDVLTFDVVGRVERGLFFLDLL